MTGSAAERPARAVVVTVSTSLARGTGRAATEVDAVRADVATEDRSGPVLVAGLAALGFDVAGPRVVADGDAVGEALRQALAEGHDVVLLSGGTGLTADDTTPEQVAPLLDRAVPGIAEALRADGRARGVATAALSRGVAGVAGSTLVVALPGSPGACRDAMELLGPLLPHAVAQLRGDHRHGSRDSPGGPGGRGS